VVYRRHLYDWVIICYLPTSYKGNQKQILIYGFTPTTPMSCRKARLLEDLQARSFGFVGLMLEPHDASFFRLKPKLNKPPKKKNVPKSLQKAQAQPPPQRFFKVSLPTISMENFTSIHRSLEALGQWF